MRRLAVSLFFGATLGATALPAQAAGQICEVVKLDDVARILGQRVERATPAKGIPSEACTYMTASGPRGPQMFIVNRFLIAVPPGTEKTLMMSTGDDEYVPVPAFGKEAVMNRATDELVFRRGATVYQLIARGVACEKMEDIAEEKKACKNKRAAVLNAAAALIL